MYDGTVERARGVPSSEVLLEERCRGGRAQRRVIVIAGPTASGKSRLAMEIATLLPGEIISADSVQVYSRMDIGSAKPTPEERERVPHHLIDIREITEGPFNVTDFHKEAVLAIRSVLQRGRTPIVVGGTGYYLHALVYGPPGGPPRSLRVRRELEEDLKKFGPEALYERLRAYDPSYARTIGLRDRQKIVRALEIIATTGERVSHLSGSGEGKVSKEFDFRCWFIYFPKEILYPRIEMRCDEMLSQGFIEEVETLRDSLRQNGAAAHAIGYRRCLDFLETDRTDEEWEKFVWEFKKDSRRYAKRQFTWFRREPLFRWIDLDVYGYERALDLIVRDYESRY
ncbi:MAG: tRNA (adenosine(37)-N6)-dimethylallyltransferase MiaA [Simkaniaceae bacterium]|nr:tRNA (adenosine(37)-N6)-dimethylallyltransferase MiaA [Simkaniaceae bacterium]